MSTASAPNRAPKPKTGLARFFHLVYVRLHTLWTIGFPLSLVWPHWSYDEMGDQKGKVILITGGNSGTGYATAKAYYDRGAKVYIACRSAERATQAIADIERGGVVNRVGVMDYRPVDAKRVGSLEYIHLDLSDLESVAACAEEFGRRESRLDVLFANAGVMAIPAGQYTKQGYSLQFGTNVLGHQHLITLLLPLLRATSAATPTRPARLIVLTSAMHMDAPKGGVPYDKLTKPGKPMEDFEEYNASKWGDLALAKWVDTHYGPRSAGADVSSNTTGEVISIAVHPGVVASGLWSHFPLWSVVQRFPWIMYPVGILPAKGALNQVWAAELPVDKARELSGGYVVCYQRPGCIRDDLHDPAVVDRLWDWCDAQVKRAE